MLEKRNQRTESLKFVSLGIAANVGKHEKSNALTEQISFDPKKGFKLDMRHNCKSSLIPT